MKSGFPKGNPDFFYVYGVRDMNAVSVQKYLTSVFYARALRCLNKIGCDCGIAKFENCVFICLYSHLLLSL